MNSDGYKETEIGLIPEGWDFLSLDNICNIQMGQSPPSKYYNIESKGLPFFQGRKDFGNKYPKVTVWCSKPNRIAEEGDVLLSVRAPVGDVNVSKEKCCIGRGLSSVAMKNNNNEFLYYLFQHNKKRLKDIFESEGTVFGCITKKGLHDFKVAVPQDQEQSKIVKILSKFDQKIELNHDMNRTLEAIGQAIFRHWFVNFEFPDGEGRPYKSSGGEMVDSELGEIPQGWKFGEIGDIITEKKEKIKKDEKYEVLSAVKTGNLVRSDDYFNKRVYSKDISKYKEVLKYYFAYNPARINIGSIGMLDSNILGAVSPVYTVFKPQENCHIFINMLLKQKSIKEQIIQLCSGTVRQTLDYNGFSKIQTIIPDLNVILQYNKKYENIVNLINHNKKENLNLSNIRDLILPKIITGKIRVNIPGEATVK